MPYTLLKKSPTKFTSGRHKTSYSTTIDLSLPVLGLVEDVIPVTADTLAAEQAWEPTALRNHFLRNHHFVLGLWLANNELADLLRC